MVNKHKYSTYVIIVAIGLLLIASISALGSDDIDDICNSDNHTLYRWEGIWRCASFWDMDINISVNNVTNIYNNRSEFWDNLDTPSDIAESIYWYNMTSATPNTNIFDQWLNTTSNTTFDYVDLTGNLDFQEIADGIIFDATTDDGEIRSYSTTNIRSGFPSDKGAQMEYYHRDDANWPGDMVFVYGGYADTGNVRFSYYDGSTWRSVMNYDSAGNMNISGYLYGNSPVKFIEGIKILDKYGFNTSIIDGFFEIYSAYNDKISFDGNQTAPHTLMFKGTQGMRFWSDNAGAQMCGLTNAGDLTCSGEITGTEVYANTEPVSPWLYNMTTPAFITPSGFNWNMTDDGSNVVLDMSSVAGNNYFGIETDGAFLQLYSNPNPAIDYLLFTITETQGADTFLNFYEGGTGHNRFWDSGSMRIGGGASYLCSNITTDVDCNTPSEPGGMGADLIVADDGWFGGRVLSREQINSSTEIYVNNATAISPWLYNSTDTGMIQSAINGSSLTLANTTITDKICLSSDCAHYIYYNGSATIWT